MGNIARERIFILDMPYDPPNSDFTYLSALVEEGRKEPPLPPLLWVKGQGARQVAYLCFSSGTSGLPVKPPLPTITTRLPSNTNAELTAPLFSRKES